MTSPLTRRQYSRTDTTHHQRKERLTNVAGVRRWNLSRARAAGWGFGVPELFLKEPVAGARFYFALQNEDFLVSGELTAPARHAYITPHTARRPRYGAMARPRSSSRISVKRLPIVVGSSGLRSFSDFGTKTTVPGCLTSESEERETWTAESLRAVPEFGAIPYRVRPDETSAVDVSGQHQLRAGRRGEMVGTLVKRCDQPGEISSNLRV